MSSKSRLLLVERVIPADGVTSEATLFDIDMMVSVGGLKRTQSQYEALLRDAGFRLTRAVPTTSVRTLLEAAPAEA